jgi:hypothetical protein
VHCLECCCKPAPPEAGSHPKHASRLTLWRVICPALLAQTTIANCLGKLVKLRTHATPRSNQCPRKAPRRALPQGHLPFT